MGSDILLFGPCWLQATNNASAEGAQRRSIQAGCKAAHLGLENALQHPCPAGCPAQRGGRPWRTRGKPGGAHRVWISGQWCGAQSAGAGERTSNVSSLVHATVHCAECVPIVLLVLLDCFADVRGKCRLASSYDFQRRPPRCLPVLEKKPGISVLCLNGLSRTLVGSLNDK